MRPSACHGLIYHTPDIYQQYKISIMGHVLKALLTELANPLAVLNPQVITLSAYFSLREPFFFFLHGQIVEPMAPSGSNRPQGFCLKQKSSENDRITQSSFYITTISRGIEIINLSYFHFIETLAHDEHCVAVTSCKIQ